MSRIACTNVLSLGVDVVGEFSYYDAEIARPWTEVEELAQLYSDAHKDAYGFRPRGDWEHLSADQLRAMIDELGPVIDASIEEERRAQDAAAVRFEQRVADTIKTGAGDRATALRWIHDAEDTGGDAEYLCYTLGLRYGYFR